jgi:hypothetical protein
MDKTDKTYGSEQMKRRAQQRMQTFHFRQFIFPERIDVARI